jgi:short-subunit dehydrogenase
MLDFTGQIAVVTGASKGIGYFIAKELADAGAHVIAAARSPDGLRKLQDENDGKAKDRFTPRAVDLANMDEIDALANSSKAAGVGLTCLSPMQVNSGRLAPSRIWTRSSSNIRFW